MKNILLLFLLLAIETSVFANENSDSQEPTPDEQCAHHWDENQMVAIVEGGLPIKIEIDDQGNLYGIVTDPETGDKNEYICSCVEGELLCD